MALVTKEMFLERVKATYGDKVEIIGEYKGYSQDIEFIYKCKHGETKHITKAKSLVGHKSCCYCFRCRYPNRDKIYVGAIFGKWTVIDDSYSNNTCKCKCECGTVKDVDNYTLITGTSTSCGCERRTSEAISRLSAKLKKYNDFVVRDNYVIMYTTKNEPFFVSIEDFGKVKKICWSKNNSGYLTGNAEHGKIVLLHRYIMDCPPNMDVDHIHGSDTKHDNRRSNLRIVTRSQNKMNTLPPSTNTSGYKGVYYSKDRKKWIAQISFGINDKTGKKKCYYLGSYDKIEETVKARKEAEEKYFGEYSYDNSNIKK